MYHTSASLLVFQQFYLGEILSPILFKLWVGLRAIFRGIYKVSAVLSPAFSNTEGTDLLVYILK